MVREPKRSDERTIAIFVNFLNALGPCNLNITEWPEDTGQPNQIDAIAGHLAIEHTSIDALPRQREMNKRFDEFIGDIEARTKNNFGCRLRIDIPFDALKKGLARKELNKFMLDWISNHAKTLPDGTHEIVDVPNIPFPFAVIKGGPIGTDGVIFARRFQENPDLHLQIKDIIASKLPKLTMRRSRTKKAALLVESDDIALMTSEHFATAFDAAFPQWPTDLDELWFAHKISGVEIIFSDLRTNQNWAYLVDKCSARAFL